MPKQLLVLLPVVAVAAWFGLKHYQIKGLDDLTVEPRSEQAAGTATGQTAPSPTNKETIRIATFNVNPLNANKLARPSVAGNLIRIIRNFDIIALQHVVGSDRSLVLEMVQQLNADGRRYTFATGPRGTDDSTEPISVFLFDQATVEIDPSTVCLLEDPANRLRHKPLTAAFRARGPAPNQAATFTLVSVQISLERAVQELDLVDDVYRAVRDDGRNEDDIIIMGDLNADARHLQYWEQTLHLTPAISQFPSTIRGTRLSDNFLVDRRAVVEYTGRSGVFDVMREFDLAMQEASEISDHLPVWVEMSIYEGGQGGYVAQRPVATPR